MYVQIRIVFEIFEQNHLFEMAKFRSYQNRLFRFVSQTLAVPNTIRIASHVLSLLLFFRKPVVTVFLEIFKRRFIYFHTKSVVLRTNIKYTTSALHRYESWKWSNERIQI